MLCIPSSRRSQHVHEFLELIVCHLCHLFACGFFRHLVLKNPGRQCTNLRWRLTLQSKVVLRRHCVVVGVLLVHRVPDGGAIRAAPHGILQAGRWLHTGNTRLSHLKCMIR